MLRNTLRSSVVCSLFHCILLTFISVLPTNVSLAQPPDLLSSYRFVSRHSTLHVQGGFAGFDIDASITGSFDFVNGFRFDFPSLDPYAAIVNVDAKAINPTDFGPYSFDLDAAVNLTGLAGKPLPVAAPFDVFEFRGEDGQGAPMDLTVIKLGRWLYMKGSNDPPCCDFFEYEIEALTRQTPFADFTRDDRIDERDLAAWSAGFGYDTSGDANNDSDSDGGDFLTWQQQLGEVMPSMESFASLAAIASPHAEVSSVPEPSTWALLAVAMLLAGTPLSRLEF